MSNQNINIASQNVQGKCDLKCSYNFNYSESNTNALNNGVMITLSYDNNGSSPVTYNNQNYNVSNIIIVSPSIHLFNDSQASAEIIIGHTPVTSGPTLNVAIPITSSSESSIASNLITEVIQSVSKNAPSKGDSTNLNINGFTLKSIVPQKPFFSYTENSNTDWIIYSILYAIPLNSTTLNTLSQIIKPFPIPTPGGPLFYNSSGPNSATSSVGSGIYIKCNPTGSSLEESPVEYSKATTSYNLITLLQSPSSMLIVKIIIGCIIFIIIFGLANTFFSFVTKRIPNTIKNLHN